MNLTEHRAGPTTASFPLLTPGDPEWDLARGTFNLLDDQRPDAIAVPADADDVAAAVRHARDHGLRVTARATGHGASSLGALDGTLLVNTSHLTEIEIDVDARRVRVGAAARWKDVVPRLSAVGLAALHGSSPDVGIAGYSLGGGIGWLGRKHGMQTNAVRAIELVTADGRLVRADDEHHADLFWALRGGGGNFGVVTAFEFDVFPVAEVYAGALFFPLERTADVLRTWSGLLPTFPDELTTWASVFHFPPFDDVPEAVRGRSFVVLLVAFLGERAEGDRRLEPFRALGPVMDTLDVRPPLGLATLAMDPEQPLPFRSTTALLDRLTPEAIDEVARIAGPGSPLALVEFRHLGGALGRPAPGAGARASLPGEIAMLSLGVVPEPGLDAVVQGRLGELAAAVASERVGDYPNFVMQPADASAFFDADTWARLERVKTAWDPEDLFRANHHVPVAEGSPAHAG